MDRISILGLALGLAAILGGQVLEGGALSSLLQLTAFAIVIGGTLGAVMLQSTPAVFFEGLRLAGWAFRPPPADFRGAIDRVMIWAGTARRGGLLALEPLIPGVADRYTRKGLQLLVDGADPKALREALELEIDSWEDFHAQAARVWDAAGGYAPTIGIIGAVMGLIQVMENLSDPARLGGGIAVAFVATIYGVGAANLLFLPLAGKLKATIARQVRLREMIADGLTAIATGENPRNIELHLEGYMAGPAAKEALPGQRTVRPVRREA
jgi:chemotaxis protein MotA